MYHCKYIWSLLILCCYTFNTLNGQCNRQLDSLALVDLYNATGGANWTNTWDLNQPIDTWYGVTLDGNGCVDSLELSNNNLIGSLIDLNLSNLEYLDLSDNQLTGSIPDFSNLPNLTHLLLYLNQLTGNVPDFSDIPNLTYLYLNDNQLDSCADFTNMPNLIYFDNYDNQLTFDDIIPNSGKASSTYSYAPQDSAGTIQTYSFQTGQTQILNLGFDDTVNTSTYYWYKDGILLDSTTTNQYTITNAQLSDAGQYDVRITNSIATDLTLYTRPITVTVQNYSCRYTDSLALVEFFNASNGVNWDFDNSCTSYLSYGGWGQVANHGNRWDSIGFGLPIDQWHGISLNNDGCVNRLVLRCVNIDTVPPLNLSELTGLFIYDNDSIKGPIPDLTSSPSLSQITFYNNKWNTTIPSTVWDLSALGYLRISNNQFSGTIPPDIGDLQNISYLSMSNNNFSGTIPSELGKDTLLETLHLDNNDNLTGDITAIFRNFKRMRWLNLGNNNLQGSIHFINDMPSLSELRIGGNAFTGTISDSIQYLNSLSVFWINHNQLTGTVPAILNQKPGLWSVLLQNNQFSGTLPDLTNLTNLSHLYLHSNAFTFEGMETLYQFTDTLSTGSTFLYTPQDSIPTYQNGTQLYVSAGGTLANNTYTWYQDGIALPSIFGDSTFTPTQVGNYRCEVTNSILNGLILYSEVLVFNNLGCRYQDSLALVELYDSTDGANWTNIWDLNQPMDSWFGVTLDGNGCVICLDLDGFANCNNSPIGNNLIGTIPNLNLPNLTGLYLSANSPVGSIPDFSNLPNLERLSIHEMELTIIPDFSNLPNLKFLGAYDNKITGTIPDFSNLPNLEALSLIDNEFSGIVPDFTNLPNLINLYISENNIDSIPPFTNISNLIYFLCHGNQVTFDDIISNISITVNYDYSPQDSAGTTQTYSLLTGQTQILNLGFDDTVNTSTYYWYKDGVLFDSTTTNQYIITNAQPSDAGQYDVRITNSIATDLTLYARPITVTIQTTCRYLDSLELIQLYNTTGGVNWINNWDSTQPIDTWYGVTLDGNGCVTQLSLDANNVTGILNSFLNLTSLEYLSLDSNLLGGTIPNIPTLPNLRYFSVDANQLTGTIPNLIFVPNLTHFSLGGNQLSGSIPNFFNLPNLTYLSLIGNQLDGVIPDLNLPSLVEFLAYNNQLSDSLPNFDNLTNLSILSLENNLLSGTLPSFPNLNNLTILSLHSNNLEGIIPNWSSMSNLTSLYLQSNQLDSCENLTNLVNLANFYNYDNQLTFDDITSNINLVSSSYWYTPQDSVGTEQTHLINQSVSFIIDLGFDDTVSTSTYHWYKDGTLIGTTTDNQYIFNNIQLSDAGRYDVQVTNSIATGLTLYVRPIFLNVCGLDGMSIQTNAISCNGQSDGEIIIQQSGLGNYSYTLDGLSTSDTILGLSAGNYTLGIQYGLGCSDDTTLTIIEPLPLGIATVQNPTLCNGSADGTASALVTGGNGGNTYLWNTGDATQNIQNLAAGLYSVTVTDAKNCTTSGTVTVTEPPALEGTGSILTPIDCNGGTATITASATGGTPNYSYEWLGILNFATINNISPGDYYLQVTDANGCTDLDTLSVTAPDSMQSAISIINSLDCYDSQDGVVQVHPQGGTLPYTFAWDNGQTDSVAVNLANGTFIVTITDSNNCTHTDTVSLTAPSAITTSVTLNAFVSCAGFNDGVATVQGSGGTGTYTYSWDNGITTAQNTSLTAGMHGVTVTDINGCMAIDSIVVFEPTLLTATTATVVDSCNQGKGQFTVTPSGGQPPYNFNWLPNVSTSNAAVSLAEGIYTITITDFNNCTTVVVDTVGHYCDSCTLFPPIVPLNTDFTYECLGDSVANVILQVTGGSPTYYGVGTYQIVLSGSSITNNGTFSTSSNSFTFSVAHGDIWTVQVWDSTNCDTLTLSDQFLEDNTNCDLCELYPFSIQVNRDTLVLPNTSLQLLAESNAPFITGQGTYEWLPPTQLTCVNCHNPIAQITAPITYTVEATNIFGCTARDTVIVAIPNVHDPDSLIPILNPVTGITPDGPTNNTLVFENLDLFPDNELIIYNLQGGQVYKASPYRNNWNGREFGTGGKPLPHGIYYYLFSTDTNKSEELKLIHYVFIFR